MEGDDLMYGFVGDNGDEEGKQCLQVNMCFNLMRLSKRSMLQKTKLFGGFDLQI
jgi:hypothetical protein